MSPQVKATIEEADDLLDAFDDAWKEGMDHETGYHFAHRLRRVLVSLMKAVQEDAS